MQHRQALPSRDVPAAITKAVTSLTQWSPGEAPEQSREKSQAQHVEDDRGSDVGRDIEALYNIMLGSRGSRACRRAISGLLCEPRRSNVADLKTW